MNTMNSKILKAFLNKSITIENLENSNYLNNVNKFFNNRIKITPINKYVTFLHLACFTKNYQLVKYLVNRGAQINIHDGSGMTPLVYALNQPNNVRVVKFLLDNGANLSLYIHDHLLPIHYVTQFNDIKYIDILLRYGANINSLTRYDENHVLHIGIHNLNPKLIKYLLSIKNIKINLKNNNNITPLQMVRYFLQTLYSNGNLEMFEIYSNDYRKNELKLKNIESQILNKASKQIQSKYIKYRKNKKNKRIAAKHALYKFLPQNTINNILYKAKLHKK